MSFFEFFIKVKESIQNWKEKNRTRKNTMPYLPAHLWILKFYETLQKLDVKRIL